MNRNATTIIAPEDPGVDTLKVPVLEIFDGDGFLTRVTDPLRNLEFEAMIRFGFTDAPEVEQPGGPEAKEFLSSLISGRWIELVILVKMDTGGIVDRHGRVVAIPYLTGDYQGDCLVWASNTLHVDARVCVGSPITRNIELEMVLNGWAWVLERYGPDEQYLDALADARRHRRGIWAVEGNVHPWEFKKQTYRNRRARRVVSRQSSLFSNERTMNTCPVDGCGGRLVERNGRFGPFFGCSNYPECRYSCS